MFAKEILWKWRGSFTRATASTKSAMLATTTKFRPKTASVPTVASTTTSVESMSTCRVKKKVRKLNAVSRCSRFRLGNLKSLFRLIRSKRIAVSWLRKKRSRDRSVSSQISKT